LVPAKLTISTGNESGKIITENDDLLKREVGAIRRHARTWGGEERF